MSNADGSLKITISVGGEFHAFRLAEQLEQRGVLHRLVTTHYPRRGERISRRRIVANPVPELCMRGPRMVGLAWPTGEYLKAVLFDRWAARRVLDCDVLVAWASYSLRSIRAAKSAGVCTIVDRGSTHVSTQRALIDEEYRRWGCSAPAVDHRLLARQLEEYGEADYISVPTTFSLQTFLDHGVARERLLRIPYGADLGIFSPGRFPGRPFRILTVGLGLRKGTPYLLEATSRLTLPDIEVWLAGVVPPDIAPVLRRSRASFRHLGAFSHSRLAAVYREASVFVLASIEEGLPMAILEAMASGLPVIVTPNTGLDDIIVNGREGIVVPARDPEAIRRALLELYEDEDRRRVMGEAAARTARAWTWDHYGERAAAEYARVVAARVEPAGSVRADRGASRGSVGR